MAFGVVTAFSDKILRKVDFGTLAEGLIGRTIEITVTSVLQITAGKMIFARAKEENGRMMPGILRYNACRRDGYAS